MTQCPECGRVFTHCREVPNEHVCYEISDDEWRSIIREKWQNIALDMLTALARETGDDTCSGEEAREIVADYIDEKEWWALEPEDRDRLLEEALPEESWCR